MRIIAGSRRSKKLKPLTGTGIRPTSDKTREAIFNMLGQNMKGETVLDLFAGTGALGIEALSRGAASAVFVDGSSESVRIIRDNLDACGLSGAAKIHRLELPRRISVLKAAGLTFDLVFMDPPYDKGLVSPTLDSLQNQNLMAGGCRIVIEHSRSESPAAENAGLRRDNVRKYGKTLVTLFTYVL